MHRLAWHDPNRSESEVRESLVIALLDSGETVMLQDEQQRYIFITNLPSVWEKPGTISENLRDEDIFGDAIAATLANAKRDMHSSGSRVTVEVSAGDEQIFQFQISRSITTDGRLITKTIIRDVSVDRRREQLLRTLLREVSHRSRNLMAIIQSLSDQTARFSLSKDEFQRKFRGRLHALAQSQDLVTDSDWRGAELHALLRQQVELYLPEFPEMVRIEGEDIFLNPNAALYIGLAFHELVVNTVSHRQDFTQGESVKVTSCRDGANILLKWEESITNRVETGNAEDKQKASFGSVVLEKVVPVALNGTAEYRVAGNKISYSLSFADSSLA